MQITDFVKPSGNFLKAEEVKTSQNPEFVITNEAQVVDNDYKGKVNQRLHVEGEFDKEAKLFDMSKTNARTVAQALGNDTTKWIGHKLILETYKTKTSEGKLTDAINVKEVK